MEMYRRTFRLCSIVVFIIVSSHCALSASKQDVLKDPTLEVANDSISLEICAPKLSPQFFSEDCELPVDYQKNLVTAIVIFRHGARTPVFYYAKDPYSSFDYGVEGLGQLTGEGKHASYRLGQYLRCRYKSFLKQRYTMSQVHCQSSETDRTAMTGAAVLAGLFPPSEEEAIPNLQWQPVPCFTIPQPMDNKIQGVKICPPYEKMKAENAPNLTAVLGKDGAQFLRMLANETGNNLKSFWDVSAVEDIITIQRCQFGLPFPPWYSRVAKDVESLSLLQFTQLMVTNEMKRIHSGVLLKDIIRNMNAVLGVNEEFKDLNQFMFHRRALLYLYSGHDTTLSGLLGVLGVYNKSEPPPYNAAVFVELLKNPDDANQHIVKVFYRGHSDGVAEEILIPGCENPCLYSKFKEITQFFRVSSAEWNGLCGVGVSPANANQTCSTAKS